MSFTTRLPAIIATHEKDILVEWIKTIAAEGSGREELLKNGEWQQQCRDVLDAIRQTLLAGKLDNLQADEWSRVRDLLAGITRSRLAAGFSFKEVAHFIFSLKQPMFARLRQEYATDAKGLADETWLASQLLDTLGLYTTECHIKAKEEMIQRQQEEMLELSTPVVKLWDGILALPLIGTLDSARTQVVMETLLQHVVQTGSEVVIIDITGVPTVDTLVAQHLLKTVTAARLMGTDCIISGIRPQIAQTIVHLGVDLSMVVTKSSLADAFEIALRRLDLRVTRRRALGGPGAERMTAVTAPTASSAEG